MAQIKNQHKKREKYMRIIEFHNKVIDKANEFVSNNKTSPGMQKITIFVMLHYLIKSYKLIKGVNLLCKAKLEGNAKILLRSLFEAFCLSSYVAEKPNDITRTEDCLIRGFIAEKKRIKDLKNLRFLDIKAINDDNIKRQVIKKSKKIDQIDGKIIQNYKESLDKLRKRSDYSKLTDKQIQNKFESEINNKIYSLLNKIYKSEKGVRKNLIYKYYASVIRDLAASVHCNDFQSHVHRNEKGEWEFFKVDKGKYIDLILLMSFNLFIKIMNMTNKTLKFQKDLMVQKLDEEYGKLRFAPNNG